MESTDTLARAINIIEREVNGRASMWPALAVAASRSQSLDMDTRHAKPHVLALLRQSHAEEIQVVCTSTTASSLSVVLEQLTVVNFPSDELDHFKGKPQWPRWQLSLSRADRHELRGWVDRAIEDPAVATDEKALPSLPGRWQGLEDRVGVPAIAMNWRNDENLKGDVKGRTIPFLPRKAPRELPSLVV